MDLQTLKTLGWQTVPWQAWFFARQAWPTCVKAAATLQHSKVGRCWVHPDRLQLHPEDLELQPALEKAGVAVQCDPIPPVTPEWLPVKLATHILHPVLSGLQLVENPVNRYLGGPTPLASVLGGGLLGAGLGYLGGRAAEWFLPDEYFEPGRLGRTGALLGGALGAAPGLAIGASGMQLNQEDGQSPWQAWIEPNRLFGPDLQKQGMDDSLGSVLGDLGEVLNLRPAQPPPGLQPTLLYRVPFIPAQPLTQAIWQDPYTPPAIQAAAAGLVQGARLTSGGDSLVSPADIARLALHMGSGYASASLVGRTLGALAGLRPEAQDKLQQAGLWAGALKAVIPGVFS